MRLAQEASDAADAARAEADAARAELEVLARSFHESEQILEEAVARAEEESASEARSSEDWRR